VRDIIKQFRFKRVVFPTGFVFGTSTSAYQIEGQQFGSAGISHWDSFAATPGNVHLAQNGALACDHYHRYAEDLDLVAAAGLDAYRFSTAWSRVMPQGTGRANAAGLDFYDRLVDAICARDLKPFLTLYHWELPAPLADRGGWCNSDIVDWFAEFADVLLRRIGDRLYATAPINEPWCVAWLSHFLGLHAPGLRDIRAASRALHYVQIAQTRALDVIRTYGAGRAGVVFNFEYASAADDNHASRKAAQFYDAIFNRWFLEGSCLGEYPAEALEFVEPYLPVGWQQDLERSAVPLDWIGINYYTRKLIAPAVDLTLPAVAARTGGLPQTTMGWEIYPPGLGEFLRRVNATSGGAVPIYITENGISADDRVTATGIDDGVRIDYIDAHLTEVRAALADGVPVVGYFVWSLLDNYEWTLGYSKRFGLVHVDFDTLERTPKHSWYALREALVG
jgi:beta-glucosidase